MHHLGGRRIFRGLCCQPCKTAMRQIFAAEEQCFALGKTEAQRVDGVLHPGLIGVQEGALDLGPEALCRKPDWRGGNHSCPALKCSDELIEVVRRREDIAVDKHDMVVAGLAKPLRHVVQFGVLAEFVLAGQDPRPSIRVFGNKLAGERQNRILLLRHAEQNLIVGIVDLEG